jgi:Holliday junction DNA helicase RuvA
MIVFLLGKYVTKSPAMVWMEVQGIGYEVNISLHTYANIQQAESGKLFTYLQIKEDAHTLYGFFDEEERNIFLYLISVSGVGSSTARMMLSSMKPDDIRKAILNGDERTLEKIKGIGAKSAKRLILELRDKMMKLPESENKLDVAHNNLENDALNALMSLGIARLAAQNALQKVLKQEADLNLEETIKLALKNL